MNFQMPDCILNRLRIARDALATPDASMPNELSDPILQTPWTIWLLLSLVRHRDRQQFVLDSMQFRLGGDASELARLGSLGHPSGQATGLVPCDTEWEYRFHGRGCAMTNRLTGEYLDVDFLDETADWITPYFYVNYLESLSNPTFVESRVRDLYPTAETVELGFAELEELGLLVRHETDRVFKLAFDWQPYSEVLVAFEHQWHLDQVKSLVAWSVSDWFMLKSEKVRADCCTIARRQRLLQFCRNGDRNLEANALQALADFDYPDLDNELKRVLAGPVDHRLGRAVQIINDKRLARVYADELAELSSKIDPNGTLPAPHIWSTVAELLLHLNPSDNLLNSFLKLKSQGLSEAAILAMEFNLPFAMILIRRALRSTIPHNRIQIASVLAIIDLPWCHAELKSVLDETIDQESTTECRSALLESRNSELHLWVHAWEKANPYSPPSGKNQTVGEWAKQRDDAMIQYEIQLLHDRIYPLRDRFIPAST